MVHRKVSIVTAGFHQSSAHHLKNKNRKKMKKTKTRYLFQLRHVEHKLITARCMLLARSYQIVQAVSPPCAASEYEKAAGERSCSVFLNAGSHILCGQHHHPDRSLASSLLQRRISSFLLDFASVTLWIPD
jgi:hypothetical protein